MEVAERARCLVLGGHSIDSLEPLFGMCVIGEVHPDRMLTNAGACAGDLLVLTKPLGTGILTTALKRDALLETGLDEAVRSMTTLNEGAARAALAVGVSAATDVTGFGLLGHLGHMLVASKVARRDRLRRPADSRPCPQPRRVAGSCRAAPARNLEAAGAVEWAEDLSQTERLLCVDAQTSGGLLLAVPPENAAALLDALRDEATPAAASSAGSPPGRRVRFASAGRCSIRIMSPLRWTAQRMDQLEHAARTGRRVALMRRGTEFIVVALRVTTEAATRCWWAACR